MLDLSKYYDLLEKNLSFSRKNVGRTLITLLIVLIFFAVGNFISGYFSETGTQVAQNIYVSEKENIISQEVNIESKVSISYISFYNSGDKYTLEFLVQNLLDKKFLIDRLDISLSKLVGGSSGGGQPDITYNIIFEETILELNSENSIQVNGKSYVSYVTDFGNGPVGGLNISMETPLVINENFYSKITLNIPKEIKIDDVKKTFHSKNAKISGSGGKEYISTLLKESDSDLGVIGSVFEIDDIRSAYITLHTDIKSMQKIEGFRLFGIECSNGGTLKCETTKIVD